MSGNKLEQLLIDCGALQEGHFKLSSGKHSRYYVQCGLAMTYSTRAKKLVNPIKSAVEHLEIDTIVSPAMGGILVGYELASQLSKEFLFTERVDGKFEFRRGFKLRPHRNVLIVGIFDGLC